MTTVLDFPAHGKIIGVKDDHVVFQPAGTSYELQLRPVAGRYDGALNVPLQAYIRVVARKLYTVSSGGNFIQPIFGPPRILQGRVRSISDRQIVLHAAVPVIVELPTDPAAMDLNSGEFAVNSMVNVVALPGATIEFRPG